MEIKRKSRTTKKKNLLWLLMLISIGIVSGQESNEQVTISTLQIQYSLERVRMKLNDDADIEFSFRSKSFDLNAMHNHQQTLFNNTISKDELIYYIRKTLTRKIQEQNLLKQFIKTIKRCQDAFNVSISYQEPFLHHPINTLRKLSSIETNLSTSYTVNLGSTLEITLPLYSGTSSWPVQYLNQTSTNYTFITLDKTTGNYKMSPPLYSFNVVNSYSIQFDACNDTGSGACQVISSYSFTLNVINDAPIYVSTPTNYSTKTLVNSTYLVPNYTDTEGHIASTEGISPVSFISWNSSINGFDIYPSSQSHVGVYLISLNLSDGGGASTLYTFSIEVNNSAPKWSSKMNNLTYTAKLYYKRTLPKIVDPDPGAVVTWTFTQSAPPIVSLSNLTNKAVNYLTFDAQFSEIGVHNITLNATDGIDYTLLYFKITLVNSAPYFKNTSKIYPLVPQTVNLHKNFVYVLPSQIDDQLEAITVSCSHPTFIACNSSAVVISPTDISLLETTNAVNVTLTDSSSCSKTYTFDVKVPNQLPKFDSGIVSLGNVTVPLNSTYNLTIPPYSDPDLTIPGIRFYQTAPNVTAILSSSNTLTISPTYFNETGVHSTQIGLYDLFTEVKYNLSIIVTNTAPYFTSPALPFQNMTVLQKQMNYFSFSYADAENNPVNVSAYDTFKNVKTIAPTSLIKLINSTTIQINSSNFADVGLHQIDVQIQDGEPKLTINSFFINITNTPPYFVKDKPPGQMKIRFNLSTEYILPSVADKENNTITYYILSNPSVDEFIDTSFSDRLILSPNAWSQVNSYQIQLILSDRQANSTPHEIKLLVENTPPRFARDKPEKQSVQLSKVIIYNLPKIVDDENNNFEVKLTSPPQFVTFNSEDNSIKIHPKNPNTDLGLFSVQGYITDQDLKTNFEFEVTIYNLPPKFKQLPNNLKSSVYAQSTFLMPFGEDDEGLTITYKVNSADGGPLPQFINYYKQTNTLNVNADQDRYVGGYPLQMCISDDYASEICEKFTLQVEDPIKEKMKKKEVAAFSSTVLAPKIQQYKASIAISKIQNDGIVILRVNGQKGSQELSAAILNSTLQFNIASKIDEKIPYSIVSNNPLKPEITIKLSFQYPQSISTGMEVDVLQVIILKDITITRENYLGFIKQKTSTSREIPQQISDSLQEFASTFKDGNLQISKSMLVNFIFSMFIQIIWNMFDDFSFLTINTMISLTVPGIAQLVNSVLINFIYVDILLTDLWLPQLFEGSNQNQTKNEDDEQKSSGLNYYFEQNGFSSKVLVKNLGSTFIYIGIYILAIILYIMIIPLAKLFQMMEKLRILMAKQLFMNLSLKIFFSQFPPLLLSALINTYNMKFDSLIELISSSATIAIFAVLPIGFVTSFIILRKFREEKKHEDLTFNERYSEVLSKDHKRNLIGTYWKVITLLRWTFTLIIMVFARDHFNLQILSLYCLSILSQAFILGSKPFIESSDQKMSLFNEIATSFYLYLLMLLTDFMGDTGFREQIGWALLILIGGVAVINFSKVLLKLPQIYNIVVSKVKKWKFFKQKSSNTVSIKPQQQAMNTFCEEPTNFITNHSIENFIQEPRENFETNKEKVDRMAQFESPVLQVIDIIEEEFKEPDMDHHPAQQSKLSMQKQDRPNNSMQIDKEHELIKKRYIEAQKRFNDLVVKYQKQY